MEGPIAIPLPDKVLRTIVENSKDYAIMHGAAMRSKTNFSKDMVQFAPFALLPSPLPRQQFQRAVEIQTVLNELMHKVAYDRKFLTDCLKNTIQVDEFTGNLFKIYETIMDEGPAQVSTKFSKKYANLVNCNKIRKEIRTNPFMLW